MREFGDLFNQLEAGIRSGTISISALREEYGDRVNGLLKDFPGIIGSEEDNNRDHNNEGIRTQLGELFSELVSRHGIKRGELASESGISLPTSRHILEGKGKGKKLGIIAQVMQCFRVELVFQLSEPNSLHGDYCMVFNGEDSAEFCAKYSRMCRAMGNITAAELDIRIAKEKKLTSGTNGYTSRIESAQNSYGITIDTMGVIAKVCGLEVVLRIQDKNPQN